MANLYLIIPEIQTVEVGHFHCENMDQDWLWRRIALSECCFLVLIVKHYSAQSKRILETAFQHLLVILLVGVITNFGPKNKI